MKTIGPRKECLGTYRCLRKNILEKNVKFHSNTLKMNHWMLPRPELLDFLDTLHSDHSWAQSRGAGKAQRENDDGKMMQNEKCHVYGW